MKDWLGLISFSVIINRLDKSSKLKSNVVSKHHIKKLSKLHNHKKLALGEYPSTFICETVHNFLSNVEPFSTSLNGNRLFAELDILYQNILNDILNLPERDTIALKTKLRHTCEKYSQFINLQ